MEILAHPCEISWDAGRAMLYFRPDAFVACLVAYLRRLPLPELHVVSAAMKATKRA